MKNIIIKNLKKHKKKTHLLLFCFLVTSVLIIGGKITYGIILSDKNEVDNHFEISGLNVIPHEDFTPPKHLKQGQTVKKQVWFENKGNLDVYVRVRILPYWSNGLPLIVNGKSTITLNFSNNNYWIKKGDFYYYKKILKPNEKTKNILESVTLNKNIPDYYKKQDFKVDVILESIQTKPKEVLKEVWGLDKIPS